LVVLFAHPIVSDAAKTSFRSEVSVGRGSGCCCNDKERGGAELNHPPIKGESMSIFTSVYADYFDFDGWYSGVAAIFSRRGTLIAAVEARSDPLHQFSDGHGFAPYRNITDITCQEPI